VDDISNSLSMLLFVLLIIFSVAVSVIITCSSRKFFHLNMLYTRYQILISSVQLQDLYKSIKQMFPYSI